MHPQITFIVTAHAKTLSIISCKMRMDQSLFVDLSLKMKVIHVICLWRMLNIGLFYPSRYISRITYFVKLGTIPKVIYILGLQLQKCSWQKLAARQRGYCPTQLVLMQSHFILYRTSQLNLVMKESLAATYLGLEFVSLSSGQIVPYAWTGGWLQQDKKQTAWFEEHPQLFFETDHPVCIWNPV